MEPFIISPPFGTYIRHDGARSVLGSYTLKERPGRALRIAQFVLDNLIWPVPNGWRNRIGLRNPGIGSVRKFDESYIYSLVGLEPGDWEILLALFAEDPDRFINERVVLELNVGCPNVHDYTISERTLAAYCRQFRIILKLPAEIDKALPLAEIGAQAGVNYLHCSNTYPSERGGISGQPLKHVNLITVEEIAKRHTIPIIAGGGIYSYDDLLDYRNVGAAHFSLATVWFRPWEAQKIIQSYCEGADA